ncbi:SNF2 family N-terminal domain-containing protein [Kalaharituber pfeilii]|nr:SNF2 family N-terminal domain-containing protein [Kalaharituber pfeilii]
MITVLSQWESQIREHFEPGTLSFHCYYGGQNTDSAALVKFDIVLVSYETLRNRIHKDPKQQQLFSGVHWFRIILDEAHKLGGHSTQKNKAICTLEADRRWCLSGTPIQNSVNDFGILYQFLRAAPFHDLRVFSKHIGKPLDIKKAESEKKNEAREKLRLLLNSTLLRRTKRKVQLQLELAPKIEQVCYGQLSSSEQQLYDACREFSIKLLEHGLPNATSLDVILRLRQICNHGSALLRGHFSQQLQQYINSQAISPKQTPVSMLHFSPESMTGEPCGI